MIAKLREDLRVLIGRKPSARDWVRAFILKREFHIMLVYRLSYRCYEMKLPVLPSVLQRINIVLAGIEISFTIDIAGGFKVHHGGGTVIGDADIHERVSVFQNVTIGANYPELTNTGKRKGYPTIESGVTIFPGAKIVGPITVGSGSIIGANAVVVSDVPPGSVVAAPRSEIRSLAARMAAAGGGAV